MTDEPLLRKSLAANPAGDTARLAYADWLDEHDRPVEAALQRVLAEPERDERRLEYADVVGEDRGEFIRVQVELTRRTATPLPDGERCTCLATDSASPTTCSEGDKRPGAVGS